MFEIVIHCPSQTLLCYEDDNNMGIKLTLQHHLSWKRVLLDVLQISVHAGLLSGKICIGKHAFGVAQNLEMHSFPISLSLSLMHACKCNRNIRIWDKGDLTKIIVFISKDVKEPAKLSLSYILKHILIFHIRNRTISHEHHLYLYSTLKIEQYLISITNMCTTGEPLCIAQLVPPPI